MGSVLHNIETHHCYTSAEEVNNICQPLFKEYNLHFFQYIKNYYKGGRLLLCTNPDWVKDYFHYEHYLHEYVNFGHKYKFNEVGFNIWSGCTKNHNGCRLWNHTQKTYDIDHMLAIFCSYDNYCELFHFGGKDNMGHLSSLLVSNLDIFEKFSLYFLEKAKHLVKKERKNLFYPPKAVEFEDTNYWILGIPLQEKELFLKKMPLSSFPLKGKLEEGVLSYRQMQCIKGIIDRKSHKEIANDLDLSHKTIDYHMSEIRKIFNVNTKKQLVQYVTEHDLIRYLKYFE